MTECLSGRLKLQRQDGASEISATLHANFEDVLIAEVLRAQAFTRGNLLENPVYRRVSRRIQGEDSE